MVSRVGTPVVCSELVAVCVVARGPLGPRPIFLVEMIPGMTGGAVTSPLSTNPLEGVGRCTNHGARWGSEQGRFGLIGL